MPTYQVTAPDGRKFKLTGDSPPSEAELEQVFAGMPKAEAAPQRYLPVMVGDRPAGQRPVSEEEYQQSMADTEGGLKTIAATGAMMALPGIGSSVPGIIGGAARFATSPLGIGTIQAGTAALEGKSPTRVAKEGIVGTLAGYGLGKIIPLSLKARLAQSILRSMVPTAEAEAPAVAEAVAAKVAPSVSAPAVQAADAAPALARPIPGTPTTPAAVMPSASVTPPTPLSQQVMSAPLLKAKIQQLAQHGVNPEGIAEALGYNGLPPAEAKMAVDAVLGSRLTAGAAPVAQAAQAAAPQIPSIAALPKPTLATAAAKAEDVAQTVLKLKDTGLSPGQIASALKDTHNIPKRDAAKMVKMILDAQIPHGPLLPDGERMMATNLGGKMPPKVPASDEDLSALLQASIRPATMPAPVVGGYEALLARTPSNAPYLQELLQNQINAYRMARP